MRRTIAGFAVVAGFALLAACGGGGGGGSTPPVVGPSGNPGPSSHPSSSPSPGPTPTSSTSPAPTPSPTPTSTPKPTPSPTPSASSTPNSTLTVNTGFGEINGLDDQIKSSAPNSHNNAGEGDLEPGDPGALPQGGGQGAVVDGIPTATTMSSEYHVHAFLGIYVNGQEVAVPDGVGMVNPFGDFQGTDPNAPSYNTCTGGAPSFECYADGFYYIHTHDASGEIHLEAPSSSPCGVQNGVYVGPCNYSLFTFGQLLDIWGISLTPNNFGLFVGPVQIYTSPIAYVPCPGAGACYTPSNTYSLYTGDPTQIPLYSHSVIWILVGSGNPTGSSLPNIQWVTGTP